MRNLGNLVYLFFVRWISLQLQVMNSPFSQEQAELLNKILPSLTESQKVWLSGYLAAIQAAPATTISESVSVAPLVEASKPVSKEVTILFGSQTGNAQRLATKAGKTLGSNGFQVTVSSMSDFKPNNLKKLQNLLIVASTR